MSSASTSSFTTSGALIVGDLMDAPLSALKETEEEERRHTNERLVQYCRGNVKSGKNAMKFGKYTLQFCRSESYKASSPSFPESYHDSSKHLGSAFTTSKPGDQKTRIRATNILSHFDSDELTGFCKSCTARDAALEVGAERTLAEIQLMSKVQSVALLSSPGDSKPITIFIRGDDDSARYKTLNAIMAGTRSSSVNSSNSSSGIGIGYGGTKLQNSFSTVNTKNIRSIYEDALLKANFVMRAFTVYRKFQFKSESLGDSLLGDDARRRGDIRSSYNRGGGGGLSELFATPVSAAINKFELEIDIESNEINMAELSCVLLDYKVLMGRFMKSDSSMMFNFNIFYDFVNEISELDPDLTKELGLGGSGSVVEGGTVPLVHRSKLASKFDLLNRPLFNYLLQLQESSAASSAASYFPDSGTVRGGSSITSSNSINQDLFDLANINAPPLISPDINLQTDLHQIFTCLSCLDFSGDDLGAICKILAAILHIGNINPAEASSTIIKVKRKGIGVPLPRNSKGTHHETAIKSGDFWHLREHSFSCGQVSSVELASLLGIDELQLRDLILSKISHKVSEKSGFNNQSEHDEFDLKTPLGSKFIDVLKHLGVKSSENVEDEEDKDDEGHDIDLAHIQDNLDALSKELYQRLIRWIVFKINSYFSKIKTIKLPKEATFSTSTSNVSSVSRKQATRVNSSENNNSSSANEILESHQSYKLVLVDVPAARDGSQTNELGSIYDLSINYINDNLTCAVVRDTLKLKSMLSAKSTSAPSASRSDGSTLINVLESTKTWLKDATHYKTCLDAKSIGLLSLLDYYSTSRGLGIGGVGGGMAGDASFLIAAIEAQTNSRKISLGNNDNSQRFGTKCGFYSVKNGFVVSHTQGDVKYAIKGMMASNVDCSDHISIKLDSIFNRFANSNNVVVDALTCRQEDFSSDTAELSWSKKLSSNSSNINNYCMSSSSSSYGNSMLTSGNGALIGSENVWRCAHHGESMMGIALRVAFGMSGLLDGSFHYEAFINIAVNDPFEAPSLRYLGWEGAQISSGNLFEDSNSFSDAAVSRQLQQYHLQKSYSFIQAQYPFRCDLIDLYDSLWQFVEYFRMKQSHDCVDSTELIASIYLLVKKVFPAESYHISDAHIYFRLQPDAYLGHLQIDLENICATKINRVLRGWCYRNKYMKTRRVISTVQYLFRMRRARRTFTRAIELACNCCREGSENDTTAIEMVYRDKSISPSTTISIIHNLRFKLRCLVRTQTLYHEIDGLNRAIESGDLPLLSGFLNSLSPTERQDKLWIRDKKFFYRSVFHSAVIGGNLGILKELKPDVEELLFVDLQSNFLTHFAFFTPNPAVIRYMHSMLQKYSSSCLNVHRDLMRLQLRKIVSMTGWLMKQSRYNTWQSRWFIIKDSHLRYYKATLSTSVDNFEDEVKLGPESCYIEAFEHQSLASAKGLSNSKPFTILVKMRPGCQSRKGRSELSLCAKTYSEFYDWLVALGNCGCVLPSFISKATLASAKLSATSSKSTTTQMDLENLFFFDRNLSCLWSSERNIDNQTALHCLTLAERDEHLLRQDDTDNVSIAVSESTELSLQRRTVRKLDNDTMSSKDFIVNLLSIACMLLDFGCPINAIDISGKSALALAVDRGNFELAGTLLLRGAESSPTIDSHQHKALVAVKQAKANHSLLLKEYYSMNKSKLGRVEIPPPFVPECTYLSIYLDKLVSTSRKSKISSLLAPFIVICICDASSNNSVLDEFISPYPAAYRTSTSLLFGFSYLLRVPLEILPDKFVIKAYLKDFELVHRTAPIVCEGSVTLSKNGLNLDDFKSITLSDTGADAFRYKLSVDASFIREESNLIALTTYDHLLSANMVMSYLESVNSDQLVDAHIEEMKDILLYEESYFGLKIAKCVGIDSLESSADWTWFIATSNQDVKAGEVMKSVGGIEGVDAVAPTNLRTRQKFICLVAKDIAIKEAAYLRESKTKVRTATL